MSVTTTTLREEGRRLTSEGGSLATLGHRDEACGRGREV